MSSVSVQSECLILPGKIKRNTHGGRADVRRVCMLMSGNWHETENRTVALEMRIKIRFDFAILQGVGANFGSLNCGECVLATWPNSVHRTHIVQHCVESVLAFCLINLRLESGSLSQVSFHIIKTHLAITNKLQFKKMADVLTWFLIYLSDQSFFILEPTHYKLKNVPF